MKLNKIYNEDCLDTMSRMNDNFIDLTVTSPPYDKLRNYNIFVFDWKVVINELYRVTKDGGVVVWIVGDATVKGSESGTSFKQALYGIECGFKLHDTMIYQKDNCPFPSLNRYYANFEYMFIFVKEKLKTFNPIIDRKNKSFGRKITGTNRQKDGTTKPIKNKGNEIKEFGVRFNNWLISDGKRQSKHPAVFPEQLANDHILSWSNEGDLVYDCFMGSGTTAKMSILNNRNWIGSETSLDYCKIIQERISNIEPTMF
jgi:site-specific DNA-methyltransferase (adenine-specific)